LAVTPRIRRKAHSYEAPGPVQRLIYVILYSMLQKVQCIKKHQLLLFVLILLFAGILYSYFNRGLFYFLFDGNSKYILSYIRSFGVFSHVAFVLIVVLEVVLAPIPPFALYIIGGILFGGFYGGALALAGNTIGAYIDFMIARNLMKKGIEKKVDIKLRRTFERYFERFGTVSIFLLRVNPVTSSDLVSYLAGLTSLRPVPFLVATTLGLAPLVFFQTLVGDNLFQKNSFFVGITIFFSIFYFILFLYLITLSLIKKKDS